MSPQCYSTNPSDASYARSMLKALTVSCPMGGNPDECFCHQVRQWDLGKRLQWVNGLSDQECVEFYTWHLSCLDGMSRGEQAVPRLPKLKEPQTPGDS